MLSIAQQYTGLGPGSGVSCPDGSAPPGGDLSKCTSPDPDWKKIAIYAGVGLGVLLASAVIVKAVSN